MMKILKMIIHDDGMMYNVKIENTYDNDIYYGFGIQMLQDFRSVSDYLWEIMH